MKSENKTTNHATSGSRRGNTREYRSLDSFQVGKVIQLMQQKKRDSFDTTYKWTDGKAIKCTISLGCIVVVYARMDDNEKKVVSEKICFSEAQNNYGGHNRLYFICPRCARRSRFLYLVPPIFRCRVCAKLNYSSQQATDNEHFVAGRIFDLLEDKFYTDLTEIHREDLESFVPVRPKGMHRATYAKRLIELSTLQSEYTKKRNNRLKKTEKRNHTIYSLQDELSESFGEIPPLSHLGTNTASQKGDET